MIVVLDLEAKCSSHFVLDSKTTTPRFACTSCQSEDNFAIRLVRTHTRFQFQSAGWGGRRRQRRGSAVVRSNIFLSRNQLTSRKALIESLRSVGTSGAKRRTDGGKKSAGMGWAAERRVSPLAWPIGNAAGLLFRGAAMVPTKIN